VTRVEEGLVCYLLCMPQVSEQPFNKRAAHGADCSSSIPGCLKMTLRLCRGCYSLTSYAAGESASAVAVPAGPQGHELALAEARARGAPPSQHRR